MEPLELDISSPPSPLRWGPDLQILRSPSVGALYYSRLQNDRQVQAPGVSVVRILEQTNQI
jgi:hypothetical protein